MREGSERGKYEGRENKEGKKREVKVAKRRGKRRKTDGDEMRNEREEEKKGQ